MGKTKAKAVTTEVKETAATVMEQKFNKGAILQSVDFVRYRDLLKVILKDGEVYAISEVKEKLKAYLNKEV